MRGLLLWIPILFLPSASWAGKISMSLDKCGIYSLTGRLHINSNGLAVLTVFPKTTKKFNLKLYRLSADDRIAFTNEEIKVQASVFHLQPIPSARILASPKIYKHATERENPLVLEEEKACE